MRRRGRRVYEGAQRLAPNHPGTEPSGGQPVGISAAKRSLRLRASAEAFDVLRANGSSKISKAELIEARGPEHPRPLAGANQSSYPSSRVDNPHTVELRIVDPSVVHVDGPVDGDNEGAEQRDCCARMYGLGPAKAGRYRFIGARPDTEVSGCTRMGSVASGFSRTIATMASKTITAPAPAAVTNATSSGNLYRDETKNAMRVTAYAGTNDATPALGLHR